MRDQEVRATLYVPEGVVVTFEDSVKGNIGRSTKNDQNYYRNDMVGHTWRMDGNGVLKCQDCPPNQVDDDNNDGQIIINEDGIDININDRNEKGKIIINEDGIDIDVKDNGDTFKMKVDENGVEIKSDDN